MKIIAVSEDLLSELVRRQGLVLEDAAGKVVELQRMDEEVAPQRRIALIGIAAEGEARSDCRCSPSRGTYDWT